MSPINHSRNLNEFCVESASGALHVNVLVCDPHEVFSVVRETNTRGKWKFHRAMHFRVKWHRSSWSVSLCWLIQPTYEWCHDELGTCLHTLLTNIALSMLLLSFLLRASVGLPYPSCLWRCHCAYLINSIHFCIVTPPRCFSVRREPSWSEPESKFSSISTFVQGFVKSVNLPCSSSSLKWNYICLP